MSISAMPTIFSTGTRVRRPLKDYNCNLARLLGLAGVFFAVMLLAFGLVGELKDEVDGVAPTVVISGFTLLIASGAGLYSTYRYLREFWLVVMVLIVSIGAIVGCVGCIAVSIIGYHEERPQSGHVNSSLLLRSSLEGCQLMLGTVGMFISAAFMYNCANAMFRDSCYGRGTSHRFPESRSHVRYSPDSLSASTPVIRSGRNATVSSNNVTSSSTAADNSAIVQDEVPVITIHTEN